MPRSHGIAVLLEDGIFKTAEGRATATRYFQQVDEAIRATFTPDQYARLTPADYTWTTKHDAAQKLLCIHVRVQEPAPLAKL